MSDGAGSTKERILDAAERLFGEHGVGATSLRSVIGEAGVNLAAVHYHFGSKDGLVEAVVKRRVDPINQERLAMLAELEKEAGAGPIPIESLVRAFVLPWVRPDTQGKAGGAMRRLLGRLLNEPDFFQRIAPRQFAGVRQRFLKAFQLALPQLDADEIFWRLMFSIGVISHTLMVAPSIKALSGGACKEITAELMLDRVISFVTAGLLAPRTGGRK